MIDNWNVTNRLNCYIGIKLYEKLIANDSRDRL